MNIRAYRRILAALCLPLITSSWANAATSTWTSTATGTGLWQTGAAWSGGNAPLAGDDLIFNAPIAGGTRNTTNDFAANTQFNSITAINAYIFNGNAINLAGNVTNNGSAAVWTMNLNTALQQDSTWFVGFSNGRIDVNGDISGSFGLIKDGTGTVRLQSGTKSYAGNTTVSAGTLDLNVANALPSGTGKGNIAVNSGATLGLRFGQNINGLTGSGLVTALSSGTKGLTLGNGDASGSFGGVIQNGSGAIGLTKVGTGTQTLTGANLYTGATAVNGGTLLVNGSLANSITTVAAAGILGGNGTLGGNTTITGQLDPGAAANTIGTLTFSANLTLNAASTTSIQISHATLTSDLLSVGGTLTLGGTWNISSIDTPLLAGDTFNLFDATTVAGSVGLLNLPTLDDGLSWDTTLFGTTGVISVTAVPEPTTLSLAALGAVAALLIRRRKV